MKNCVAKIAGLLTVNVTDRVGKLDDLSRRIEEEGKY